MGAENAVTSKRHRSSHPTALHAGPIIWKQIEFTCQAEPSINLINRVRALAEAAVKASVSMEDVSRILTAIEQGDPKAAEQLLPLVYDELRELAAQRLGRRSRDRLSRPRPWSTRPTSAWWRARTPRTGTAGAIS